MATSSDEGQLPDWPPFAQQRTEDDRLATLKEEVAQEQAAIRELEAQLAEVAGNRDVRSEPQRYRRALRFGLFLGVMGWVFVFVLLLPAGAP